MNQMLLRRRVCWWNIFGDYIQNGLIFQLDGVWNDGKNQSHKINIGYWKELVSEEPIYPSSGTLSWGDNYAYFDGGTYLFFNNATIINAINNNNVTIEMILEPKKGGESRNNGYIGLGESVRGFWFWNNSDSDISGYSYRDNGYQAVDGDFNKIQITLYNNYFFIDNIVYGVVVGNGNITNSNCYISKCAGIGMASYKLYALRIYNRKLSLEEHLYNCHIDTKKYGITTEQNLIEVEYIESSTKIETNVIHNNEIGRYEIEFLGTPQYIEGDFFGTRSGYGGAICGFYHYFIFGYNSPYTRIDSATFNDSETNFIVSYEFRAEERVLTVNGISYRSNEANYNDSVVCLFGSNSTAGSARIKLKKFKVYSKNNELLHNFIPYRLGQQGVLKDTISGLVFLCRSSSVGMDKV